MPRFQRKTTTRGSARSRTRNPPLVSGSCAQLRAPELRSLPLVAFNKLKPVHVNVDMDGVFVEWDERLNEILLRLDPTFPVVAATERKHYDDLMKRGGNKDTLAAALSHPDLYKNLRPNLDMVRAIAEMNDDDRIIVSICTMPSTKNLTCCRYKLEQIEELFGADLLSRTALTTDKTLSGGEWLIDDKSKIVGAKTPSWKHVLFDRPYNQGCLPGDTWEVRMTHPSQWEEILLPNSMRSVA